MLAVTLPGATELRLEAEAEVRRRGWPVVDTPAAADLLLVCGVPAPGDAQWLDAVGGSMPEPALRVVVGENGRVADALDRARAELVDRAATRRPAAAVADVPVAPGPGPHEGHGDVHGHGHGTHHDSPPPEASAGPGDHTGHDMHGMQGMGGMHNMHAMGEVAGLPMAERGDDRDGLRLDQLHVPLGPALSDWPAGLILRCTLQGDVVQDVEVDHLPAAPGRRLPFWDEPWLRAARGEPVTGDRAARRRCAAHLDSVGRLLAVVGWEDVAARCRRLRDALLSGTSREVIGGDLRRTLRRIRRSRTLRWSITGLGELPAARARAAGVTGPALAADGDAHDRLLVWIGEIERGLDGLDDEGPLTPDDRTGPRGVLGGSRPPSQALLSLLPELLIGAEFAGARIVVASLDPDLEELTSAALSGAAHG